MKNLINKILRESDDLDWIRDVQPRGKDDIRVDDVYIVYRDRKIDTILYQFIITEISEHDIVFYKMLQNNNVDADEGEEPVGWTLDIPLRRAESLIEEGFWNLDE